MIDIIKDKLPKVYERTIIEEYYNFFNELYGTTKLFYFDTPRFTTDRSKLRKNDLRSRALIEAIAAYESIKEPQIEFLGYGKDEVLSALARITVEPEKRVQMCDAIFLDYQDEAEKTNILQELIIAMEDYGVVLECEKSYVEIPKFSTLLELVRLLGYTPIDEPAAITNSARTYLLEKSLVPKRDENEPTLSRK